MKKSSKCCQTIWYWKSLQMFMIKKSLNDVSWDQKEPTYTKQLFSNCYYILVVARSLKTDKYIYKSFEGNCIK